MNEHSNARKMHTVDLGELFPIGIAKLSSRLI